MKLLDCTIEEQKSIKQNFVLPSELSSVYIQNQIPYQMYGPCKVALSVKVKNLYDGGFHTSGSLN